MSICQAIVTSILFINWTKIPGVAEALSTLLCLHSDINLIPLWWERCFWHSCVFGYDNCIWSCTIALLDHCWARIYDQLVIENSDSKNSIPKYSCTQAQHTTTDSFRIPREKVHVCFGTTIFYSQAPYILVNIGTKISDSSHIRTSLPLDPRGLWGPKNRPQIRA